MLSISFSRTYVNNDNFLCSYWRSFCQRSDKAVLPVFCSYLPAFWCWYTNGGGYLWWFFLGASRAMLTASGFFLPPCWRINVFTTILTFLHAFLIWYIVNDYNPQVWPYLRSTIAVLSVKVFFSPSIFLEMLQMVGHN